MAEYLIYFNQQWVGDHTEEWFRSRGPLARAVVDEMKAAGVYVFAGGLEEDVDTAFSADATSGELMFTDGPFVETKEWLGGLTVVDVADERDRQDVGRQDRGSVRLAPGGPPLRADAVDRVQPPDVNDREDPRFWTRMSALGGRGPTASRTVHPGVRRVPRPSDRAHRDRRPRRRTVRVGGDLAPQHRAGGRPAGLRDREGPKAATQPWYDFARSPNPLWGRGTSSAPW